MKMSGTKNETKVTCYNKDRDNDILVTSANDFYAFATEIDLWTPTKLMPIMSRQNDLDLLSP